MSERSPEELIQTRLLTRGVPEPRPVNLRSRKRYCLIGLLAIGLIVLWCHYDSYERVYQVKLPLRVCLVLFAGIAVPCYLLLTRGWRGVISILIMHLFLAACISLAYLAAFIAHISCRSADFVVATPLRG